MLRYLLFTIGVAAGSAAMAADVPDLDIKATCRKEPRLLPSDPNPYPECMSEEMAARVELAKAWTTFKMRDQNLCVEQTFIGGVPSYVDVLTCLQMTR